MELAISAVTGELVNRFISFLANKYYSSRACSEEKQLKRLQQLLLRIGMVIDEADSRYIANSCMIIQLKTLAAAMYRGHHVLDTIRNMKHKKFLEELVCDSSALSVYTPYKRSRTIDSSRATNMVINSELQSALQNLEAGVANMAEFVVLLGGCERISCRPYDAYLYIDNFMFGRHVEKQQLMGFLLEHNSPGPPAMLPVIGGNGVGKKTLVAHVCNHERVRSHFSMILHLKGDDLSRITEHEWTSGRTLVVIEFVSDVNEDEWETFHRSITNLDRGSKVVILGRSTELGKFGTVKPISLDCLAFQEYCYLFKTLAFGSANPRDHSRLAAMVEEFAMVLGESLILGNLLAYALRKNLSTQFWMYRLNWARDTVRKNMSSFGAHPHELFIRGCPLHLMGRHILYPAAPSSIVGSANGMASFPDEDLPRIMFGDLIATAGHTVFPRGDFRLISWESRLPPYTSFSHLVRSASTCVDDKPETPLSGKKRPGQFA
ncbi:putative disease resistance protein RGA3 [Lolium perenne]|uniref:putative disease resistance protein RGA3 n=1 Tax=Lolium perenne TaxID=4522 RepID=UPI0021EB40F5|nr:putative disease resistance protein RGA3 [Lolium perenne]